jgi:hypothetical protein
MPDGGGGGTTVVPFNMAELAPFFPSVFNGPYNAEGAYQNEQMLAQKYPWITPPAGQFEGAQPGQFANPGGFPGSGVNPAPNPNPPIPPTLGGPLPPPTPPPSSGNGKGGMVGMPNMPGMGMQGGGAPPPAPPPPPAAMSQVNPQAMGSNQVNAMQPAMLQQIMAVLGGQLGGGQPQTG